MIELPDRPAFHPPKCGRLRTKQYGGHTAAGPRVARHEGRLHVVEVEDGRLGREVEHERHHLLVLDLQQVDRHLVGGAADRLEHRRAPETCRREAPRRQHPVGHPRRRDPPRDGPHVDPEVASPALSAPPSSYPHSTSWPRPARRRAMANERWWPPLFSGNGRNLVTMSVLTAPPPQCRETRPSPCSGPPRGTGPPPRPPGRPGCGAPRRRCGPRCRQVVAEPRRPEHAAETGRQGGGLPRGDEQTRLAVGDEFGMPPASVPITGTPHACASRTLSPKGSDVDVLTSTSSERSTAGTSSTGPTKRERSPSRADASSRTWSS